MELPKKYQDKTAQILDECIREAGLEYQSDISLRHFTEKIMSLSSQAETAYYAGQEILADFYLKEAIKVNQAAIRFNRYFGI